jgi:hypothetical protein
MKLGEVTAGVLIEIEARVGTGIDVAFVEARQAIAGILSKSG